jgi:putative oxidoreductase
MENFTLILPILGRVFIGLYYVLFGFWNIYHWRPSLNIMTEKNFPLPFLVLPIGIFWQIATGSMIIFGSYVKLAALSLIVFTIIGINIFHDFWNHKGELRRLNMTVFIANITISIGALLLLLNNIAPINAWSDLSS